MPKTRNRRRKESTITRERVDGKQLSTNGVEFLAQMVARWIYQKIQSQGLLTINGTDGTSAIPTEKVRKNAGSEV